MIEEGSIKYTPNLPLNNTNLKNILQEKFKVKVEVENDANCVALSEVRFGCKKKNFIVFTLGTGIGGGIIINGELYNGFTGNGFAGEFGHIIINNGKEFENLAAGKVIKKLSKKFYGKELMVSELVRIKSNYSKKILKEIGIYFGQGIGSLINVFDPEVVILSGGFKEAGKPFLDIIKRETRKYIILPRKTKIEWTSLEHPGILGASLLV